MKKRLVALTLVAAMALGMTACGSKSNNKNRRKKKHQKKKSNPKNKIFLFFSKKLFQSAGKPYFMRLPGIFQLYSKTNIYIPSSL